MEWSSIGLAFMDGDVADADQIMRQADMALYKAKTDGRNRYRIFEPKMEEMIRSRREIGAELMKALAQDELDVHSSYHSFGDIRRRRRW